MCKLVSMKNIIIIIIIVMFHIFFKCYRQHAHVPEADHMLPTLFTCIAHSTCCLHCSHVAHTLYMLPTLAITRLVMASTRLHTTLFNIPLKTSQTQQLTVNTYTYADDITQIITHPAPNYFMQDKYQEQ